MVIFDVPRQKTWEFWDQTTEGDGNYRMLSWLEPEGAEVLIESIGMGIKYLKYNVECKFSHCREQGFPLPAMLLVNSFSGASGIRCCHRLLGAPDLPQKGVWRMDQDSSHGEIEHISR